MTTNFNFSMGVLTQRADRIISLLERDSEQLSPFGYDETFISNFTTKLTTFRTMPTDNYWLGQQILKTEAKSKALEEVQNLLVDLRFRCKYALGEQSVEYKSLRFNHIKDAKAADLILLVNHICTSCREMMDKLAARNITEANLASIEAASQTLDDAIDAQQEMRSTREAKTIEREQTANEIYATISEICEAGKNVWLNKNQACYNDYVIYGSQDSISEDEAVAGDDEDDDTAA